MPQDPSIVSTINGAGEIDLYNLGGDQKLRLHISLPMKTMVMVYHGVPIRKGTC